MWVIDITLVSITHAHLFLDLHLYHSLQVPPFVETEKIVTRFFAFFNYDRTYDRDSALGAPSVARVDARYLTIMFYVADGTCEISETKVCGAWIVYIIIGME